MKDKIKDVAFINFNTLLFDNVFKTQVLNWIIQYQKYGINFDLVMFKPIKLLYKSNRKEINYIRENNFKNKLYYRYLINPKYFFSDFYTFVVFLLLILKYIKKKRIIIQIRSPYYYKIFYYLKKIFKNKLIVVFDSRGAIAEEYKYVQQRRTGNYNVDTYNHLLLMEKKMIDIADLVFTVSNSLKDYHIAKNDNLDSNKFFISPCNADSERFFYSQNIRLKYRHKLDIEKRRVIVYSGGLEAPWHIPDKIFRLFSLLQSFSNIHFLVLTNDIEIAKKFKKKYNINNMKIFSLENSEINNYLNAADIGLLLREDEPINNVASPSKFAEYLLAGLPVIISKKVGDFSNFVINHNLGITISLYFNDIDLSNIKNFMNSDILLKRKEISNIGKEYFSKQNNLEEKIKKYISLI